jgi:hypothetical protein
VKTLPRNKSFLFPLSPFAQVFHFGTCERCTINPLMSDGYQSLRKAEKESAGVNPSSNVYRLVIGYRISELGYVAVLIGYRL